MSQDQGQGTPLVSGRATAAEPVVSALRDGIPSAVKELRANADSLRSWLRSYDEHAREEQFWGRYMLEQKVNDLFAVTGRISASLCAALDTIAEAIDTRSAETEGLGPEGESADPQGSAQTHPEVSTSEARGRG